MRAIAGPRRRRARPTRRRPAPPCAGPPRTPARSTCAIPRFKVPAVTPEDAPFAPGRSHAAARRRRRHGHRHRHDGLARAGGRRALRRPRASARASSTCLRRAARRGGRAARRAARPAASSPPRRRPSPAASARPSPALVAAERGRCRCGSSACRGFAPTGSAAFLLEHFGLTADGIADGRPGRCSADAHALTARPGDRPGHQLHQAPAGRRARAVVAAARRRSAAPPAARAGSSRPPRRSGPACAAAVAACLDGARRRARSPRSALSTQRESLLLWDRRDRRAAGPADQLAGPAHRGRLRRAAARRPRASWSATQRPAAGPDVLGAQGALAARPATTPTGAAPRAASCAWAPSTPGC